jgi:predicted nucleotidyltransferase
MISKNQKQRIISKLRPYQPERVGIFGSYARGTETAKSDLDLLVHLQKNNQSF